MRMVECVCKPLLHKIVLMNIVQQGSKGATGDDLHAEPESFALSFFSTTIWTCKFFSECNSGGQDEAEDNSRKLSGQVLNRYPGGKLGSCATTVGTTGSQAYIELPWNYLLCRYKLICVACSDILDLDRYLLWTEIEGLEGIRCLECNAERCSQSGTTETSMLAISLGFVQASLGTFEIWCCDCSCR